MKSSLSQARLWGPSWGASEGVPTALVAGRGRCRVEGRARHGGGLVTAVETRRGVVVGVLLQGVKGGSGLGTQDAVSETQRARGTAGRGGCAQC